MPGPSPQPAVRFGTFEVNLATGELRKQGIRIKLHEKPFQVLLALLDHPGEVVTRKELQELLWPQDTFVEFENSLNNTISRLREALGDTAETPRFIETLPRRGYRFLAEVSQSLPTPRAAISRPWLPIFGIVLGVCLAIGAVYRFVAIRKPAIRSLAVLPFRNLGTGTADDYFASGMTDAVTTELAKLGVSKVISETSVVQFKDTKKPVRDIAHALGVDAIVEGAVLREGNQVRITVQLIGGDTDRHLWAESYQRQMTDILALQDEVALGVAHAIKLELSPGAAGRPTSPKPVNTDAYEAYPATLRKSATSRISVQKTIFSRPFNWIPVTHLPTLVCRTSTRSRMPCRLRKRCPRRGSTRNRRCGWILICRPAMFPSRMSIFMVIGTGPPPTRSSNARLLSLRGLPGRIAGTQFI